MPHPSALLNEAQVKQIKKRLWNGDLQQDLADKFDVDPKTISAIKAGRIWAGVPWPNKKTGRLDEAQYLHILQTRRRERIEEKLKRIKKARKL